MIQPFPGNTRNIINEIRNSIGRVVTFFYVSGTYECSTCTLDPTTNLSTDPFCPECSGLYYIPNILSSGIIAHITWRDSFDRELGWFGYDFDGRVRLQIELTGEHDFIVSNCKYFVVDNHEFEVRSYSYRGVPELNRIIIIGRQKEQ